MIDSFKKFFVQASLIRYIRTFPRKSTKGFAVIFLLAFLLLEPILHAASYAIPNYFCAEPKEAPAVQSIEVDEEEDSPETGFPDLLDMENSSLQEIRQIVYYFARTGDDRAAEALYEQFQALCEKSPESILLNRCLAYTAAYLAEECVDDEQPEVDIQEYSRTLEHIASHFPENEVICLGRAQGALSMIDLLLEKGELRKAEAIYQGLVPLAKKFQNSPDICLELASCALSLEYEYVKAKQAEPADRYFQALEKEAAKFPDDPDFNSILAQGMVNEIILRKQMQRPDEAEEIYRKLEPLSDKFPDNEYINCKKLSGAFNLIIAYQNIKQYDKAEKLFREQKALLSKFPDSQKINLVFAQCAESFFPVFSENNQEKMSDFLPELGIIAKRFPEQPDIIRILTRGLLFDMWYHLKKDNQSKIALEDFQKLDALSKEFPEHPGINLNRCLGLAYLVLANSREKQEKNAKIYFQQLKAAATRFPDDPKINLVLARTAYIMKLNYDEKSSSEKIRELQKELLGIVARFPEKMDFLKLLKETERNPFPE